MTPEQAIERVHKAKHIVIRYKGVCFFNTTDEAEAGRWQELGAELRPHYSEEEIQHRRKKGRRTLQGWEVHILGAVKPIEEENADGDLVNITADALLNASRNFGA